MNAPKMLEGIRIVDQSGVVFGPYATQVLADLGADVIKVEPHTGDTFRRAGRPPVTPGMGACHMTLNRGKKSIALDLKQEEDREILRRLLGDADIYITNVRQRAIEKLGFGYEQVRAIRPDIVYVHCVGFGSDGPYGGLQAYDDVIQAATGAASLASLVDGDPRPRYIPSLIADKIAGLHAAYAALAAIIHKLRTGEGQLVEVPMFESFAHFMLLEHLYEGVFEPPTGSLGYPRQLDPFRQPFETANGYISIVPYTDAMVVPLFTLLGKPDILEDERFATPMKRFQNLSQIHREVGLLTPAKTTEEWMPLLTAARVPAMPVRPLDQMVTDPHLEATGFFKLREHPTEGLYREMQPPIRFGAAPAFEPRPAPLIDQDGDAIREQYGLPPRKAKDN